MTIIDNLKEYKKMLVGIGHESPETSGGLDCFDVNQAKLITDYVAARSACVLVTTLFSC